MVLLSFIHFMFVISAIYLSVKKIFKAKGSFLAFNLAGFCVLDSLGLAIAPYLPLEKIPYLPNAFFTINYIDVETYSRLLIAHWIFILVSMFAVLVESGWKNKNADMYQFKSTYFINIAILIFAIGLIAYIRYFIFGPGLELLKGTRLFFSSTIEAVAHRVEARNLLELRQGAYMASIASVVLFPLSSLVFLKDKKQKGKYFMILCFILSMIYAIQTRQKAPVLAILIVYSLLIVQNLHAKHIRFQIKTVFLYFLIITIIGGLIFYMINFGTSPFASLVSVFARVFIIPSATETNYFVTFPAIHDFRGIYKIINITLLSKFQLDYSDLTIYDVAYAATGDRFSSNASFIAVAWSGAGYFGVFIVSILFSLALLVIDKKFINIDNYFYLGTLILTAPALFILVSSSIFGYISYGGLVIPMIIIIIDRISRVKIKSNNINSMRGK